MRRELAALVARSPFGQAAAWPVVETVQARRPVRRGARPRARAWPPATRRGRPGAGAADRRAAGRHRAARGRAVRDRRHGRLVVNELAMRPHNSGHWTIEGARTSQFEQHLRAVLDYPLGATDADRAGGRHGERAGRRRRRSRCRSTSGCTTCSPGSRTSRCTSTARPSGRPARSGTSRRWATDMDEVRARAALAARLALDGGVGGRVVGARTRRSDPVRRASARRVASGALSRVVGVIMGSDSDWPVMEAAAEALAEFDVPLRGGRLLRAPHAAAHARLRDGGRGPRAAGDRRGRGRGGAPARAWSPRPRRCR